MQSVKDLIKLIDHLSKALKAIDKGHTASGSVQLVYIEKALTLADDFPKADIVKFLTELKSKTRSELDGKLLERRQSFLSKCRDGALPFKSVGNYDRVGYFKVEYNGPKVIVSIGSEKFLTLEVEEGSTLHEILMKEHEVLVARTPSRVAFIGAMKNAFAMAKSDGKAQDGKVAVKDLFPYIAAARQLVSDEFRRKPTEKNFQEYSMAIFAFELAKFGDSNEGWVCGESRLCNRGPNMASQDHALVLPGTSDGTVQVSTLWIQ